MWRSTRATSGRPRSITFARMPRKARRVLGWEPTVTFDGTGADHGGGGHEDCRSPLKGGCRGASACGGRRGEALVIHLRTSESWLPAARDFSGATWSGGSEQMGCRNVFVPHPLRLRSHAHRCHRAPVRRTSARGLDSPGRGRRWNRRESRQPWPLLLRQRDHGHSTHRGRPAPRRGEDGRSRDDLRVSEIHAGAVPRGATCGMDIRRRPTHPTESPRRRCSSSARPTASSTA